METPIMIFIFLCIVVLMIMFYLMLRSVDELTSTIREDRLAMTEQLKTVNRNLEHLLLVQSESRDILRAMLGPDNHHAAADEPIQEEAEAGGQHNITDYILPE